ncbi:hypothetical protein Cci01nite_83450 [Catellatospora citrea]|uniref:Uncharacterized protein n=2 Tax=Catellatospora citrea TaxID=53366 RepID=A0A8J3KHG7_9ACTN|nr:hypothetical protein C8E86_3022 [Catellatospora citrea]GIG03252.1 hypothetical protein Cci01nite_83450 [Catellatospora citrea]
MTRAYEAAVAAISAEPDPQRGFEQATEVAAELRRLADLGADLRAQSVAKIWKAEELSLAGLAERIGVSKARADQLLKSAKTPKDQPKKEGSESV